MGSRLNMSFQTISGWIFYFIHDILLYCTDKKMARNETNYVHFGLVCVHLLFIIITIRYLGIRRVWGITNSIKAK
jgi:hypothetical protein